MGFLCGLVSLPCCTFVPKYGFLIDSLRNGGHQSRKERTAHSKSKANTDGHFLLFRV